MIPTVLAVTTGSFSGHFLVRLVSSSGMGSPSPSLRCRHLTWEVSVLAIEFDVEKLIGKLDIIEKSQIPFAANQSLKRLGHLIKTQLLPAEMEKSFTAPEGMGRPVPFTLNSLKHDTNGMTLTLSLKDEAPKGTSPAEYLRSAVHGGEVTMTPLTSAIKNITGMYGRPAYGNLAQMGALTQRMDIKPSFAASMISGLERNFARKNQPRYGERYVVALQGPMPSGRGKAATAGLNPNAVYRIKGNQVSRVMTLASEKPTVNVSLEYEKFIKKTAEDRLPSLLSLSLQRALESM